VVVSVVVVVDVVVTVVVTTVLITVITEGTVKVAGALPVTSTTAVDTVPSAVSILEHDYPSPISCPHDVFEILTLISTNSAAASASISPVSLIIEEVRVSIESLASSGVVGSSITYSPLVPVPAKIALKASLNFFLIPLLGLLFFLPNAFPHLNKALILAFLFLGFFISASSAIMLSTTPVAKFSTSSPVISLALASIRSAA
jgi:hypothetical protein